MHLDPLKPRTTVDAKTAEEALALAIRLQQEKGERVPLEELQRTADEAGIDRVYLESALHQVTQAQQTPALEQEEQESFPRRARIRAMMMATFIAVMMVSLIGQGHHAPVFPFFVSAFVAALVVFRLKTSRTRGGRRRRFREW
ncbi:MAG: hypothetical protein P4L46_25185 [Fimbriimonas sp.]|nr:hypothetical protein [Fimbriimonas sp.]